MPKYKVLRPLDGGTVVYEVGAERELSRSDAAQLVKLRCLEEIEEEAVSPPDGKQEEPPKNKAEPASANKADETDTKTKKSED